MGGFIYKQRVCGMLAVTRSMGDYALKPYVIAQPDVQQIRLPIRTSVIKDDDDTVGTDTLDTTTTDTAISFVVPDFLVLACDGLWDVISDNEAVTMVYDYCHRSKTSSAQAASSSYLPNMDDVAQYLIEQALRRGTSDNITVIVVWLM
jgi:serine/threonine protein phosphatase PrpC